jgi:hypothetical protein
MTIGISFPVRDDEKIKSVPWGLLEANRARAMKNHGMPLERLYALGGLSVVEIARIMSDQDVGASIGDDQAEKIILAHRGERSKEAEATL